MSADPGGRPAQPLDQHWTTRAFDRQLAEQRQYAIERGVTVLFANGMWRVYERTRGEHPTASTTTKADADRVAYALAMTYY